MARAGRQVEHVHLTEHLEAWDHVEPWHETHRLAEESIQLAERLHRRHAQRWQRVLAALQRECAADEAWRASRAAHR